MFDIEVIMRALKNNYIIREFPVMWSADIDTRLSQATMPLHVLQELVRIKKSL